MKTLQTALKEVSFLSMMTEAELDQLVERGRSISCAAGQVVFHEGDEADALYIILSGEARIFRKDENANEGTIASLGKGDFFGEIALLDGGLRSASAVSITPCEFFTLQRAEFLHLLTTSPSLLARFLSDLTYVIRTSTEKFFREQLAKQTLQTNMEIERHRSLAQMVAGVAHEINTPLGIANTSASIIKAAMASPPITALSEDRRSKATVEDILEAVDLLQRNIQRAHTLVQSFKNISVSQIVDVLEPVNLSEAISESLELFKINARQARLEVVFQDSLTEETRTWRGYRGNLSRIVLNLLTNIQRYAYGAEGGRVELAVALQSDRAEPHFILTVQDFGRGIDAQDLPKVFEPFFTTGRSQGGTGLGLAIVYNLVTTTFKGSIQVESSPGKGTKFKITFPKNVPDDPKVEP
jgi:signal transduction histidine kinase